MKINSITENKDFLNAYKRGKSLVFPLFIVYCKKNQHLGKRLGITTGKKVGNSVARSRARRIIRVVYMKNYDIFPNNCDIVFVARKGIEKQNAEKIALSFKKRAFDFFNKMH